MTALAIRSSGGTNAVSRLHGEVTREMFGPMWPQIDADNRPVTAVTNGVHVPDVDRGGAGRPAREVHRAELDRPPRRPVGVGTASWRSPNAELWAVRQSLKRFLFTFIRERARQRWTEEHVGIPRVVAAGTLLEPDALTIGFARRFTSYKRPELVFHDGERLSADSQRVRAPRSDHLRGQIASRRRRRQASPAAGLPTRARPMFGGRVAFVDDYDLHVAHFLSRAATCG
jgi:starch phosphorylase